MADTLPMCPVVRSLKGQKALVTGANSGIGKAMALALGHAGADVVVNYVSRDEEAQKVVTEIQRCGARAYAHRADVSNEAEVERMFATMIAEFGTVDMRFTTALSDSHLCELSERDPGKVPKYRLVPKNPQKSNMSVRVHALDELRMPKIGSKVVDPMGAALIDEWINGMPADACGAQPDP